MAIVLGRCDKGNPSKASQGNSPLQGRRVLIVDDNANQRKRLRELYESMGFLFVGEASNGLEALEGAEKLKPDLISLDILMPLMHGVETLGYLKDSGCTSAVVFVSALGNLEILAELKSKGHQPEAVFSKKDTREMFVQVLSQIFSDGADGFGSFEGEKNQKLEVRAANR
jgi:two-component system, chemotaxis family, chemotaxis protein CheY